MNIKVGDYVRFYDGDIGIIAEYKYEEQYENGHIFYLTSEPNHGLCCNEKQFKTSPNLMDLIQAGDLLHTIDDNQWWTVEENQANDGCIYIEWIVIENENQFKIAVDKIITKEKLEMRSYHVG